MIHSPIIKQQDWGSLVQNTHSFFTTTPQSLILYSSNSDWGKNCFNAIYTRVRFSFPSLVLQGKPDGKFNRTRDTHTQTNTKDSLCVSIVKFNVVWGLGFSSTAPLFTTDLIHCCSLCRVTICLTSDGESLHIYYKCTLSKHKKNITA